ncbi:MAG: signal recognition particle-docking protein FtsY [Chloroflexi bacterium]|nr:signal recognition particle-docking protein FtsY [Chloroflexota bacterium]
MGIFDKFKGIDKTVQRTRESFFGHVSSLFDRREIDASLWDDLEELLIQADVGVETTDKLVSRTRERTAKERIREGEQARQVLKEEMIKVLRGNGKADSAFRIGEARPFVILVAGVNGTGKTTTIAKLTQYLQDQGHKVMLAAADTFRAAAIDQLKIWGERAGAPVIAHQPGADPGAVVYDALQSAVARSFDVLIIDTAGRLHTKFNLMEELKKVKRVLSKLDPSAPHAVLLVLDATTGQNALVQARHFTEAIGISGIVLAKLDGTARGGIVFAIIDQLGIPIKFIGTGEKLQDLAEFDAESFVGALLG